MGACHLFGVEPPVVSGCLFESQLIILEVIFADEDIKSVTGNIVEWFGLGLRLCTCFAGIMFFDVAIFGQLFLDLAQVTLCEGDVKGVGDGFQMLDLGFCVGELLGKSFLSTFEFAVAVEIFLCIFLRSQGRVKNSVP